MKNKQFFTGAFFVVVTAVLVGCGDQKVPRKTLPSLSVTDEIEGVYVPFQKRPQESNEACTFNTENVNVLSGGTMQACISISMANAGSESDIIHLLDTYKPLAVPLLSQWSKQGKRGVVLDFRSENSKALGDPDGRADYVMEKQNAFSIPIIFLWEKASAAKASNYINLFQTYASESFVNVRRIEN